MSRPMIENTNIFYVDECGIDKFLSKKYIRAREIDKIVFLPKEKRKFKRINVVTALTNGVPTAVRLYD